MSKILEFIGKQLKAQAPVLTLWAGKALFNASKNKAIYEVTLKDNKLIYNQFNEWLLNNHHDKFQNVGVSYAHYDDDEPKYEPRNDSFFIWFESHPIHISKSVEASDDNYSTREQGTYTLKTVVNKTIINDLLRTVGESYVSDKSEEDKLIIHTWTHYWKEHKKYYPKNIEDIVLNKDIKESILNSIDTWKDDNALLKDKKISTSLTHLYYGLPGTGKSSISASIAYKYGMNIYYLDLSDISDLDDLKNAFDCVEPNSMILIEDIDLVFKGRKRINKSGVKFDAFINFLSGVLAKNDVMIILTTNHIESLDPALIRAGRVDLKCEFKAPTRDMVITFLTRFYDIKIVLPEIKCMPKSMAQLEQWCIKHLRDVNGVLNILKTEPCILEENDLSERINNSTNSGKSGKTKKKKKSKPKKDSNKKLSVSSKDFQHIIQTELKK